MTFHKISIGILLILFCSLGYFFFTSSPSAPRRFYFIHIPKTGGTSLHTLLENEIDLKELYPPRRQQKADRPIAHQLVSGHFSYWFCKQLDPQFDRAFKVTILRDPIERYLSLLRYKKRNHPHLRELDLASIHKYIQDPAQWREDVGANKCCTFLASEPNLKGKELLESAKKSLQKFDFVLFLENFTEDLQKFCNMLGIDLETENQPHLNTTIPESISPEFMEVIKQHNSLDIELYKYAKKYLKRKWVSYRFRPSLPAPEKVTEVDYAFSMPLNGINWCYRENVDRCSSDYPIYRWVMDKPAKIYFNLSRRRNYRLQFTAQLLTADILPHLLVNGVEVPVTKQDNALFSTYSCDIPKKLISKKATELTFFSPKSYKYNEIHPGYPDDRPLSFAVDAIKIIPNTSE